MGKYNHWCCANPVQCWHMRHDVSCLATISYTETCSYFFGESYGV